MAEAAILGAVKTLGGLAIPHVISLLDVPGEVEMLKDKLEMMQIVLKEVDGQQVNQNITKNQISKIRGVAHDVQDVIDIFNLNVDTLTSNKNKGLFERCLVPTAYFYHHCRIWLEIKSIRANLQGITATWEMYNTIKTNINNSEGTSSSRRSSSDDREVESWRRLRPWVIDQDVVGLENDVAQLVGEVKASMEGGKRFIKNIVGIGGSGKSTLARKVYNHQDVIAARFDYQAWISVSSDFNQAEIMKKLHMELFKPKDADKMGEDEVEKSIYEGLTDKSYFIVLDDVWQNSDWEAMGTVFPKDTGSTVLLTSRNNIIPNHAHEMKALDNKQSWELFLKKVKFNDENNEGNLAQGLEEIGRQIVKECCGLPLAIAVVGRLLANKNPSKSEWQGVLSEIKPILGGRESVISKILELSYHNLSPALKSCFLCLGFFKEDATIHAEKLVQLWVASGLIQLEESGRSTLEEKGRSYLHELINRSMVQVKDMGKTDRVKKCQIHDLLRDVSIKKAKEEINFEIVRAEESSAKPLDKPRHRVVNYSAEDFIYTARNKNNSRLRSLFLYATSNTTFADNPSYWKSFKLLKILNLEDSKLITLPNTIGELAELRYLGLGGTGISKLPHSFGRLKKLEVLNIAPARDVEMPNVIWKMESLRHLYMSIHAKFKEGPLRIDTLMNLQTVSFIIVDDPMLEQLARLTSLWNLGINLNLYDRQVCSPLESLDNVTHLKLEGSLVNIPNARNFPPNLSCLTLRGACLDEDPMPELEKLPKLSSLKLDFAYKGQEMVVSDEGFPMLEVLILRRMSNLNNIRVGEEGGMPNLKRMKIGDCPFLQWKRIGQIIKVRYKLRQINQRVEAKHRLISPDQTPRSYF